MLAFAWVVRALPGTREVTWTRLLVAVVLGVLVGVTVAALIFIDVTGPLDEQLAVFEERRGDLYALALPFQVIATMVAVVELELLFARPQPRRGLRPLHPMRALRLRLVRLRWSPSKLGAR